MTKLEEKLLELGYKRHTIFYRRFIKMVGNTYVAIELDKYGEKVEEWFANDSPCPQLRQDLEELDNAKD